jgi:hypothetical protein
MAKDDLKRIKKRRRNVQPDEIHALLTEYGFTRRLATSGHWVYGHPLLDHDLTIKAARPLLPTYVSRAINAIEEVTSHEDD